MGFDPSLTTKPGGRPRKFAECHLWRSELRWGFLVLMGLIKVGEAARANAVHRTTITRWCSQILRSDEPECAAIRRHLNID